jgi:hypothetical protein
MPTIKTNFDVICDFCLADLTAEVTYENRGRLTVRVEPCSRCLEVARREGREENE